MPDEATPPETPAPDDGTQLLTPPTGGAPLLPPAAPQREVIGDFEILGRLGAGGMGAVYRARQISLDRLVALKVLPAHFADHAESVARFQREARVAASLSHPNLVRVYAAGEADGCHYFAMELIDGEDLGRRLKALGRLMPGEALRICADVARGLQYAWERAQMVHRDIKPGNIFLASDGLVKVGDLGLAKLLDSSSAGLTQTGSMMGTPHYISPEQARGDREIDFRADIYSLCCTLYQMLTGQTPYRGGEAITIIRQHLDAPLPAILKAWPECPVPLAWLVGRMLKKHRHERFGSYAELLTALETTWAQIDPVGYNPQAFAPPSKPDPEATLLVPTPGGSGEGGASSRAGAGPAAAVETTGPTPKRPAPARSKRPLYAGLAAGVLLLAALVFAFVPKKEKPAPAQRNAAVQQSSPALQRADAANPPSAPADGLKPSTTLAADAKDTPPPVKPAAPAAGVPREWLISKTASVPPPADTLEFQGSRYKFFAEVLPWLEAKVKAEAMGGHLATVTTREENDWLATKLPTFAAGEPDLIWLGGFAGAGSDEWRWITGESAELIAWGPGSPGWRDRDDKTLNPAGSKFAAGLALSMSRTFKAGRILAQAASRPSNFIGYLVEWDRFSAADAAANDPAKWKDWLADARAQGKTTLGNSPLDAKGWHVAGDETFPVRELQLRDCMARIRFDGDGVERVIIDLRQGDGHGGTARNQYYEGTVIRDAVTLTRTESDMTKTIRQTALVPTLNRNVLGSKGPHTLELRAIGDLLLLISDGELLLSARDTTLKEGTIRFQARGTCLITELATQSLDAPARSAPQSGTGVPPVKTAQNTGGTPVPPFPPTPPKPPSEMEKWLAQVDGPQQAAFQKDVLQPYETGLAGLRSRYTAALERAIVELSKAGKLEDALAHRTERDNFTKAQTLPPDDADKPVAAIQKLRAAYRTEAAKLDQTRLTAAKALHAKYDAVLAQSQTTLTQRHRLDDALLLKTHREAVKAAWLATPGGTRSVVSQTSAGGGGPQNPTGDQGRDGAQPSKDGPVTSRPVVKKYPKGDDRKAAEWVLSVGGGVDVQVGAVKTKITKSEDLPKGRFALVTARLRFPGSGPPQPIENLEALAGLEDLMALETRNLRVRDEQLAPLTSLPKLVHLTVESASLTDQAISYVSMMPALKSFSPMGNTAFTGARLAELATTKITKIAVQGCTLSPDAYPGLAKCRNLTELNLQFTETTDADLEKLTSLEDLHLLQLSRTKVTVNGLRPLKLLRRVRQFSWPIVPGKAREDFVEIARLFPQITDFDVHSVAATEPDIAALELLRALVRVNFYGAQITDDAIRGISVVRGLQVVKLTYGTSVTDLGLGYIAAHKGITEVVCTEAANITDAGLLKLAEMKQLRRVEIANCPKLTPAGFAAFQKARPDVTLVK